MRRFKVLVFVTIVGAFAGLALLELFYLPGKSDAALRNALEAKAIAIADLTAYSAGPAIEFNDQDLVKDYLTGAARDADLSYIAVIGADGNVYRAINPHGKDLLALPHSFATTTAVDLAAETLVVAPIAKNKALPCVVAGFSKANVFAESRNNQATALKIALAIFGLGVLVALGSAFMLRRHESSRLARERAEAASRAKSDFVASVSHEVRTPLTGVLGMADLLLMTDLTARQRQLVETLRRSGKHLLSIINDILDLSKIEAGKLDISPTTVHLASLVEDVAEMTAPQAKVGVELLCHVDPDLPGSVQTDPLRLTQILTNLLGNAIKFTAAGYVKLEVEVVGRSSEGVRIRFAVSDTGIGISAEGQKRLFESFYQAGESTERKFGGTGLGLSISQRLVRMMGGDVTVKSELGRGSTFSFELALSVEEVESTRDKPLAGVRALLVAPRDSGHHLGRLLRHWGAEVVAAEERNEALAAFGASLAEASGSRLHIAIVDAGVEAGSGADIVRTIAGQTKASGTKTVLLVKPADAFVEIEAPAPHAIIAKPARSMLLKRTLLSLLEGEPRHAVVTAGLEAAKPPLPLPADTPPEPRPTVLAADDNATNQEVLSALLTHLGYEIEIARDGTEAVEAFEHRGPFGVVLMDCEMPRLDGYQATSKIREIEQHTSRPRIPILALTTHTLSVVRAKVIAAGMDDVLSKPIGVDSLRHALRRWLAPAGKDPSPSPAGSQRHASPASGSQKPKIEAPQRALYPAAEDGRDGGPTIDPERIIQLRKLQTPKRPTFLRDLVTRYLSDASEHLATLRTASAAHDAERLRSVAHALKGSSRNIGAVRLGAVCEEIEQHAAAGAVTRAPEMVVRAENELAHAKRALQSMTLG